jgi:hypothetical protein
MAEVAVLGVCVTPVLEAIRLIEAIGRLVFIIYLNIFLQINL